MSTKHIVLQLPHYLFNNWKSFTEFISFVENYKEKKPGRRKSFGKTTDL